MDDLPQVLASKHRAILITPAGCGKTEMIAKAVACQEEGRQLILTHTHAGVRSLRDRFRRLGVSSRFYRVDTIAGFALTFAAKFPKSSGLGRFAPAEQDWDQVYEAGIRILSGPVGTKIINSSYEGLYVDEYQDCTVAQHRLVMTLANTLPCRIAGDPLQGIFDFGGNVLIDWDHDVFPHFERLDGPRVPWRWQKNAELGDWLLSVRDGLMKGDRVDLTRAPSCVKWLRSSDPSHISQREACFGILKEPGSIVAIQRLPHQAHSLAQKLRGSLTSMEEVESKDLLKWSAELECCTGPRRAVAVIDFASRCMTGVSSRLRTIRQRLEAGRHDIAQGLRRHREIASTLHEIAAADDLSLVLEVLPPIERIQGCVLYRRELWRSMQDALRAFVTGRYDTLQDAAWTVRDKGRIWGRIVEPRTVSRTLLIKGLEFDHSIVLDADELNAKELYVAMTRGSKSLTVVSLEPILQKDRPVLGTGA